MQTKIDGISLDEAFAYFDLFCEGYTDIYLDYFDFLKTLILKCNVDPDYVLDPSFKIDIEEAKKHITNETYDSIDIEKRIEIIKKQSKTNSRLILDENDDDETYLFKENTHALKRIKDLLLFLKGSNKKR